MSAPHFDFTTVDVFTDTRYEGNPLAIVQIPKGSSITQEQKLKIAKEFNLSETIFLHEDDGDKEGRRADIFTSVAEIPFAGHPTIGALCFIGMIEARESVPESIKLKLKAGLVEGHLDRKTLFAEAEIPQDFHVHARPLKAQSFLTTQPNLAKALETGKDDGLAYPVASIVNGMNFLMIQLSSLKELSKVSLAASALPDAASLIDEGWERGFVGSYFFVILPDSDSTLTKIRARMIDWEIGEDPATGSAACSLACYLSSKAGSTEHTLSYNIEQGTEMGRRSLIRVEVESDTTAKVKRVLLSGRAVKVQEGKIFA